MSHIYFSLYIITFFFIAIYLTLKSNANHKYVTFAISYWIFAHPVLKTEYFIIDISGLPFDFNINRIIFILFSIFLILILFQNLKNKKRKIIILNFEKYLYLYISLHIFISYIHNRDILSFRDFVVINTKLLTFLVIYLVVKRTADEGMIRVFCKALLIVCAVSSSIGIYQFLIDPQFFRIGSLRGAFLNMLRANGIFSAEYNQSYFLISGIILALFVVRNKRVKCSLIGLFFTGIIFTFHRMSWIIVVIITMLYFILIKRKRFWQIVTIGSLGVALIFLSLYAFFPEVAEIKNSSLVRDRLLKDTMIGRKSQYEMVLENIPQGWLFGFGSRKSDFYYYGMLFGGKDWALGKVGGIHNGFLAEIFYRGIIAFIAYSMFFIVAFHYFWMLARFKHFIFYIPLFEIFKFIMSNMTNSFFLDANLGLMLAIFFGISISFYRNNIYESCLLQNEEKNKKIFILQN